MQTGCTIVMSMSERENFIRACEAHNVFWSGLSKFNGVRFEATIKTSAYKMIAEDIKPLYAVSVNAKQVVTILNDNAKLFFKSQNAVVGDKLIIENYQWVKIN